MHAQQSAWVVYSLNEGRVGADSKIQVLRGEEVVVEVIVQFETNGGDGRAVYKVIQLLIGHDPCEVGLAPVERCSAAGFMAICAQRLVGLVEGHAYIG